MSVSRTDDAVVRPRVGLRETKNDQGLCRADTAAPMRGRTC